MSPPEMPGNNDPGIKLQVFSFQAYILVTLPLLLVFIGILGYFIPFLDDVAERAPRTDAFSSFLAAVRFFFLVGGIILLGLRTGYDRFLFFSTKRQVVEIHYHFFSRVYRVDLSPFDRVLGITWETPAGGMDTKAFNVVLVLDDGGKHTLNHLILTWGEAVGFAGRFQDSGVPVVPPPRKGLRITVRQNREGKPEMVFFRSSPLTWFSSS